MLQFQPIQQQNSPSNSSQTVIIHANEDYTLDELNMRTLGQEHVIKPWLVSSLHISH